SRAARRQSRRAGTRPQPRSARRGTPHLLRRAPERGMRRISAMPLRFAVTLILAVACWAETAAAERYYLVYLSSSTSCPFPTGIPDPASFQSAPGVRPLLPPTTFALNQTLTSQLCFYDWSPTPTTTPPTEVCQPSPSVKGDEVCEQLL